MMLPISFYRNKITEMQAAMAREGLDGLLILDANNVNYAIGFHHIPSERPLGVFVPQHGDPALFVPLLEQENAADTWVTDIRAYFEYPGEQHPVVWMVTEANVRRLGIDTLTVDVFRMLPEGVEITSLVERMRWIKSPEELQLVEQAAGYADYCLEMVRDHAPAMIRDGATELDILKFCVGEAAAKLRREVGERFQLRGAAVVGTVHSGPRAALPHGSPMARQPQPGELMIAGIGANVGGYHAESGATFIIGEPVGDQMRVLQAAADCNDAAVNALRPGQTCASVNEAALAVLRDYGFGDAIRHRIGHGMGLQGHESPWLAPGDTTLIEPGMVFSNEPGIYRPGIDGCRTINSMIVTEGAAYVPNRFLRDHPPEKRILSL